MLRLFKQYYPARNIFFVIGEGLIIYLSVILATWLSGSVESFSLEGLVSRKALLITMVCHVCLYYNDLYDLQITKTYSELGIRLFQALGAASIFLGLVYLVFPHAIIGKGVFLISVGIVMIIIVGWRYGYAMILNRGLFNQKIIVLGDGALRNNIIDEITGKIDCGYTISAIVQGSGDNNGTDPTYGPILHHQKGFSGLCQLAKQLGVEKIVVALKEKRGAFPVEELLACKVNGFEVLDGISFYEMLTGKLLVNHINPSWLIFSEGFQKSRPRRFFKRVIDLTLSAAMMVLLFPILLLLALWIKIDSRGPVIFSQERVGENRKNYRIHKFRSMVEDAEKKSGPRWATDNDERITRAGRIIRKTRLDELPQLWNVLKGNMSFVGPRPEREFFVKQLEAQIPYYGERFTVKPGITGWAQVSYGYGASVEDAVEKLNYDLYYIKNMSIFVDLMIVLRTVKIVLFGKGAR